MVYVQGLNKQPLAPCENVVARLLLKKGTAKVIRKVPFTIRLNYTPKNLSYPDYTLSVDTGSGTAGFAVVDDKQNVVYVSEVTVRNDIHGKMEQRKRYRRSRRSRKIRYRKPRFLNRKNSIKKGRFSPTMRSKIHAHQKEIVFVQSILPIKTIVFETGTFDPHLMKNPLLANPKVRPWGYQKGTNYGYANTHAKVLDRDNHTCQICHGKHKDSKLEVHHIVFRNMGGSDEEENLITLCHTCHTKLHNGEVKLKKSGKKKGLLRYATQMNSIRCQLLKLYPDAIETFGYITKTNRFKLNIVKTHYTDACVVATGGKMFQYKTQYVYKKRCVAKGDYQRRRGIRSEEEIPKGKINGFKKFDKVKYFGKEYFIKGRMSTGYAVLMDISEKEIKFSNLPRGFKTPKLANCKRIQARSSWMIIQEAVTPNIV